MQVSSLGAALTLSHARAFIESTTQKIKHHKANVCSRVVEPMSAYLDRNFKSALNNTTTLKQLQWVMEMNMMQKKNNS